MGVPRSRAVEILLAGLVILVLASFWGFRYFPSQDGVSHLYNAHVLLELDDPETPYGAVYERRPELVPNVLAGWLLVGLGRLLPIAVGEKLLLSLYLLGFVSAFASLSRREGRLTPVALLAPLFAFNYVLHMGFYGFALGSAAALWGWVLACRLGDGKGLAQPAALGALGLVAYLAHLATAGLLLFGVVAHAIASVVQQRSARPALRGVLPCLPTMMLIGHYLARDVPSGAAYWPAGRLFDVLVTLHGTVAYTGIQRGLAIAVATLLSALVVLGFLRNRRSHETWGWIALAGVCGVAYATLPNGSDGHWYLSERLSLFVWLALVPVARVSHLHRVQTLALLVPVAAFVGATFPHQVDLDRELREHVSVADSIEPGETVIGLTFEDLRRRGPERARPMLHATGWIAIRRNAVDAGNYEAHTDHFPLRLKAHARFPDPFLLELRPDRFAITPFVPQIRYVVTRWLDDRAPRYRRYLERHYREIARAGPTLLFERNPSNVEM